MEIPPSSSSSGGFSQELKTFQRLHSPQFSLSEGASISKSPNTLSKSTPLKSSNNPSSNLVDAPTPAILPTTLSDLFKIDYPVLGSPVFSSSEGARARTKIKQEGDSFLSPPKRVKFEKTISNVKFEAKFEAKSEYPSAKAEFTSVEQKFLEFVKLQPDSDSASKDQKDQKPDRKPFAKFEVDIKDYGLKVEEDRIQPLAYQPEFGLPGSRLFANLRPRSGELEWHSD